MEAAITSVKEVKAQPLEWSSTSRVENATGHLAPPRHTSTVPESARANGRKEGKLNHVGQVVKAYSLWNGPLQASLRTQLVT